MRKEDEEDVVEIKPEFSFKEQCSICLATDQVNPAMLLPCLHSFCSACIQYWLVRNTQCPLCKAEMPTLQAYFDAHRRQNFTIIAVDMAEPASLVSDYVARNSLTFNVWLDPQEKVYQAFRNFSLPTSWVIDPQGQVRLTWSGAISREMLEKSITPLLED